MYEITEKPHLKKKNTEQRLNSSFISTHIFLPAGRGLLKTVVVTGNPGDQFMPSSTG